MRWNLTDRVFFACGACHILAHQALDWDVLTKAKIIWIKPKKEYSGNHIFLCNDKYTFDYHGYSTKNIFIEHTFKRAQHYWSGWNAELVELPQEVLISEEKSRKYDGLWLREPRNFLYDPRPRARRYIQKITQSTSD